MKHLMKLVFVISFCFASMTAIANGNIEAGKEKSTSCAACHGAKGVSVSPMFPTLAGQHADYLAHALKGYKSGKRTNPIMRATAAALSDEDIEDLSAFYASEAGLKTLKK
jgi:cytochrome c553